MTRENTFRRIDNNDTTDANRVDADPYSESEG